MEKIRKGIYRYGNELASNRSGLILVHPWYADRRDKNVSFGKEGGGYCSNLDVLLGNSKDRNVVLFEEYFCEGWEKDNALESMKKISKLRGRPDGLHFILTERRNPYPIDTSWGEISEFLNSVSGDWCIAGGYYWKNDVGSRGGCMAYVKDVLESKGVKSKPVKGCCFG